MDSGHHAARGAGGGLSEIASPQGLLVDALAVIRIQPVAIARTRHARPTSGEVLGQMIQGKYAIAVG
jgi:hypothetical protein